MKVKLFTFLFAVVLIILAVWLNSHKTSLGTQKIPRAIQFSYTTSTEDFSNLDVQIENILADLETYQAKNKQGVTYPSTNKSNKVLSYKELPFEVKVSEYKAPNGSGYFLEIWATINNKKFYKSIGYGVEANTRTTDWVEIM